jgi:hypothetical protein
MMVPASGLKSGTILQIDRNLYKVLGTEYHMGGGKMGWDGDSCSPVYQSGRCGKGECYNGKIY